MNDVIVQSIKNNSNSLSDEQVIETLKNNNFSIVDAMRAFRQIRNVSLAEAKVKVAESKAYEKLAAEGDKFHQQIIEDFKSEEVSKDRIKFLSEKLSNESLKLNIEMQDTLKDGLE